MTRKIEIIPFMTSGLGLSGNELVLFAILWRDSNKGEKQVKADYTQISGEMNTTIPTMYNCLKNLVKRGYLSMVDKGTYELASNLKVD